MKLPQSVAGGEIAASNPGHHPRWVTRTLVLTLIILTVVAVTLNLRIYRSHGIEARLHGDPEEASNAMGELMARTPQNQRIPVLLKRLQDESPGLRYAAVDALSDIGDPGVAGAIEGTYQDSAAVVRERALIGLYKLDAERGLRLQLAGLRDEDLWVREAAIQQLAILASRTHGKLDKRAVPMLIKTLDDPTIAFMSIAALRDLTGKPWHYRLKASDAQQQAVIAQWKHWWAKAKTTWPAPAAYFDVAPIRPTRIDPAPDFRLRDLDGHTFRRDDQRGRVTLLNFWATWCPPCRVELPDLERLHEIYHERGVDVIGVSLDEKLSADNLRNWCQNHRLTYRQALATETILEDYGDIHEVPASVLIDSQGRIRYRWDGERDFTTYQSAVERLLAEPTPHS